MQVVCDRVNAAELQAFSSGDLAVILEGLLCHCTEMTVERQYVAGLG